MKRSPGSPRSSISLVVVVSFFSSFSLFYLFLLPRPVGLDIEWTPSYKKGVPPGPVALMQIADNNLIVLVRRLVPFTRKHKHPPPSSSLTDPFRPDDRLRQGKRVCVDAKDQAASETSRVSRRRIGHQGRCRNSTSVPPSNILIIPPPC